MRKQRDFFYYFCWSVIKKYYPLNLLFFDFGSGEVMLIVLVIFLIFGPDKIPGMARSLGKFINEVKRASEDIKSEINREADKKDREKKLKDYQDKINTADNGLKSQPRKSSTIVEDSDKTENNNTEKNEEQEDDKTDVNVGQ